MIQFALMAGKAALSFFGSMKQAKAIRQQAEYEAKVIEAQGKQALYDAETRATVAEFNRRREVQDTGIEEVSLSRKYRSEQKDVAASFLSRGIDPSAAFGALAAEKERDFQEIGYRSGKLQANLTSESRLAKFYGELSYRNSKIEADNVRTTGLLKSKAIKQQAFVTAASDAAGMWGEYGGSIKSSFQNLFGGDLSKSAVDNYSSFDAFGEGSRKLGFGTRSGNKLGVSNLATGGNY